MLFMLKKLMNLYTRFYCKTPETSYFEPSSHLIDYLRRTSIPQLELGDFREVLEEKVEKFLKLNYLSKDPLPNSHLEGIGPGSDQSSLVTDDKADHWRPL